MVRQPETPDHRADGEGGSGVRLLAIAFASSCALHASVLAGLPAPAWDVPAPLREPLAIRLIETPRAVRTPALPVERAVDQRPHTVPTPEPRPTRSTVVSDRAERPIVPPVRTAQTAPPPLTTPQPAESAIAVEAPGTGNPGPAPAAAPAVATAAPGPGVDPNAAIEPPRYDAAYLRNPPPDYPAMARRMRLQGTVVLRVLVGKAGNAESVRVDKSSGNSILDDAALDAVRDWRFVPARRGTEAIARWVDVPVRFRLQD